MIRLCAGPAEYVNQIVRGEAQDSLVHLISRRQNMQEIDSIDSKKLHNPLTEREVKALAVITKFGGFVMDRELSEEEVKRIHKAA